jgi:catechol 2,3-dioxygenase-like lactoylglutathione lyase family enzyme
VYPVVCSADLDAAEAFYGRLLGLDVVFACGWYTTLRSPDDPSHQLALVSAEHPSVPSPFGRPPAGVLVTFEVDDAASVAERAADLGLTIVLSLRDEPFGQRHFMAVDPDGTLVDVVQTIAPSTAFLREVARWRRQRA